jgi:hypothetical protein
MTTTTGVTAEDQDHTHTLVVPQQQQRHGEVVVSHGRKWQAQRRRKTIGMDPNELARA